MNNPIWKLITDPETKKINIAWRRFDNGKEESVLIISEQFKADIENGAELQDADGNVMSPEVAQQFIATLP